MSFGKMKNSFIEIIEVKPDKDADGFAVCTVYDKGWNLKDIQEWLGHADIETTGNIYTNVEKLLSFAQRKDCKMKYYGYLCRRVPYRHQSI